MATTAQSVILEAQTALVDLGGIRWAASELVRALNDMQRIIVSERPDATAADATLTLVAGESQTLAAGQASLIEIKRLTATPKSRVTQVRRAELDAIEPDWASATQTAAIEHFMVDQRAPRVFAVYPPAINGTQLEGVVSLYPTDVAAPGGDGKAYSTVSGNIGLPDEFKAPLLHLILFRAWSKDAEYGGNATLAASHLQAAEALLGVNLTAKLRTRPTVGQQDPPEVAG